jgi:hypothetical protein
MLENTVVGGIQGNDQRKTTGCLLFAARYPLPAKQEAISGQPLAGSR